MHPKQMPHFTLTHICCLSNEQPFTTSIVMNTVLKVDRVKSISELGISDKNRQPNTALILY